MNGKRSSPVILLPPLHFPRASACCWIALEKVLNSHPMSEATPGLLLNSEFDSQLKLEYTWQIRLSRGVAEVCIGNVRIKAPETNIIEKVERISPEHEPQVFADLKIPSEA